MSYRLPSSSNLFLTGGTGFFGKCILREVASQNRERETPCKVTVLSRDPCRFKRAYPDLALHPWVSFHQGDIVSFQFPNGNFTHMIHAAADSSSALDPDPVGRIDQIVRGTQRALEFARIAGINRFLLTSSGAVYGRQPLDLLKIPESYQGAPATELSANAYGQAKRVAEQLCTAYHSQYGIESVIARCFTFADEYLPIDWHFAIGNFIRDALYRDVIRVIGDGKAVRSYLSGKDLAQWLLAVLLDGKPAYPYNVGSDQPITIVELANLIRGLLSPEKKVIIEGSQNTGMGISRYVPDITRALTELNLESKYNIEMVIMDTANSQGRRSVVCRLPLVRDALNKSAFC